MMNHQNHAIKLTIVFGLAGLGVLAAFFFPPIAQDQSYHNFADQIQILGIPNFWNVVSNLPFLVVGYLGLSAVLGKKSVQISQAHLWAYLIFFAAVGLVSFGSAYYHFHPSNATLVWDRLPMTFAFMAFFAIIIGEFVAERAGTRLLLPLIIVGGISVWYWHFTEMSGQGDLRLYGLVQFLPMILIPVILLMFPPRFSHSGYIWAALGMYLLAKLAEMWDGEVFTVTVFIISGHSLKHIIAALGPGIFFRGLKLRTLNRTSRKFQNSKSHNK